MSQFNAIGETGFNELLAKRCNTPGGASAPSVAPEIFPVFVVEGDEPSNQWSKNVYLCGGRITSVAAAPAVRSICLFENRVGSGIIATITRIDAIPAAGTIELIIRNFVTGIAVVTSTGIRDVFGGRAIPQPVCTLATDNTGGVPAIGLTQRLVGRLYTNSGYSTDQPMVIRPGCGLWIGPDADNVALSACQLQWTERKAQPGELA